MSPAGPASGQEIDAFEGAVQTLLSRLKTANDVASVKAALACAAKLVEHSAYELARRDPPGQVTHLILTAAELERQSEKL